ncbi:mitochondrial inner membrane protein [Ophiocordyceps camponoti-floridani]|uniref:Sensitive to high expression protein 9, mitochondrial n=1 Tax=Ophiocordyceps camponoti-floridani TaxID=2030778 RepID=A0A8H4VG05_9HYPO|nr:mitochondrial inner membrane protein [Ophiocordyceps camponoti-floridani]
MPLFGRRVVRASCLPHSSSIWLPRTRLAHSSTSPGDAKSASAAASELPSAMEDRRGALNRKLSSVMDDLQSRMLTASHTLNDITGYSAIEAIKTENQNLEEQLAKAQEHVRTARLAYRSSNTKRSATQREVTTLLARKDSWLPVDLERFTELYRTDHVLEGEVTAAQEALTEAEADEQRLSQRLNAGILKRYHEEQIWSDRIRRASTWGTWGLMGMNFVLFVALQFVAEPWRRRRLVRGVVEEEKGVLREVRDELGAVKRELSRMTESEARLPVEDVVKESVGSREVTPPPPPPPPPPSTTTVGWRDVMLHPSRWRAAAADLYSERRLDLRMRDASMIAAEGALAGAAVAGGLALALTRRT